MGKLIVNGNSVYELDENCIKKRKRKNKEMPSKGQVKEKENKK
ncbi:MAG: hypothetical protein ACI39H_06195 [Lachnospiraceae bacterium]